jgi:hypothetical protein
VTPKLTLRVALAISLISFAFSAAAAPKDHAALKKINEAVNVHYLGTDFEKAEAVLLGIIEACGDDGCSGAVIAKAYMYLGIVRGGGPQDMVGAKEAFEKAKEADAKVKLDAVLAPPEVRVLFQEVMAGKKAKSEPGNEIVGAQQPAAEGGVHCTPAPGLEVEVGRQIPIACIPPSNVAQGHLSYKPVGSQEYKAIPMTMDSGMLRGQIPCDGATAAGDLMFYIRAEGKDGGTIDTLGSAQSPAAFKIVAKTSQAPPSYPGSSPPPRCDGSTEPSGSGGGAGTEGGGRRWLVGVHFAWDLWASSADTNVCSNAALLAGKYSCYDPGISTINTTTDTMPLAEEAYGGNIKNALVPATKRFLLSVDYIVTPAVTLGGRVGMAIGGGPPNIHYDNGVPRQTGQYMPAHVELRGAYWFIPLGSPGAHPYIHAGGGMAQVDGKAQVTTYHYVTTTPTTKVPVERKLDAWRKMGQAFADVGLGLLYSPTAYGGLQLNVNFMIMAPAGGIVLEPSLGYLIGF